MLVQVYLTVEEGMEGVDVSTTMPVDYKPREGHRGMVLRADIPIPDIARVDGVIRLNSTDVVMMDFVPDVKGETAARRVVSR
jgi:hypothetical protein